MNFQQVMKKSEAKLKGLHPKVKDAAEKLIELTYPKGIYVLICQGLRTNEEQAAIYAQGRTAPGSIVSNAKPGYSYHNYGLAVDYCLMDAQGGVHWDVDDHWRQVAQIGKSLGFEWGGDWTSFKDYPHLQMTFGLTIKDLLVGKRPPTYQPTPIIAASFETKEEPKVKVQDANKIINYLKKAWNEGKTQTERDEIHRLANELRKASGQQIN